MVKSIKVLLVLLVFFIFLSLPIFVKAGLLDPINPNDYKPDLKIQIGQIELNFETITCNPGEICSIGWISQYVGVVYRYGVGLAAVLAVIMIMIGGFSWLMSGGRSDSVKKAKEFITSALTGLLIALFSFIILITVNPRLVELRSIGVLAPPEGIANIDVVNETCCVCQKAIYGADQGPPDCSSGISERDCDNKEYERTLRPGVRETMTCGLVNNSCYTIQDCSQFGTFARDERLVRNVLEGAKITINKPPCQQGQTTDCTNVAGLNNIAIDGISSLGRRFGNLTLTGGTEPGHHTSYPGFKVDIRVGENSEFDNWVRSHPSYTAPWGDDPNAIHYDNVELPNGEMANIVLEDGHYDMIFFPRI